MQHAASGPGGPGRTFGRDSLQPIFDFIVEGRAVEGDAPFFIWYAPAMLQALHTPPIIYQWLYAKPGQLSELEHYYARVSSFDSAVGELLGYLEKNDLAENTLVLFIVDKGLRSNEGSDEPAGPATHPRFQSRNRNPPAPFEAAIRTPLLIRWPGRVEQESETASCPA